MNIPLYALLMHAFEKIRNMSKYYKSSKEAAQKEIDKRDKILSWVRDNLQPGMKVRFSGSRSNKGKNYWREVLDVKITERLEQVGYPNPDYVDFEPDIPYSPYGVNKQKWVDEYTRQKEEFQKIHPDDRPYLYLTCSAPDVHVVSKNISATPRIHESTIVANNSAYFLMEVEIDGIWVKAKELIRE